MVCGRVGVRRSSLERREQAAHGAARVFLIINNIGAAQVRSASSPLAPSKTFAGFNPQFRYFTTCLRVCALMRRWNISLPLIRFRSNSVKIFIWKGMIVK